MSYKFEKWEEKRDITAPYVRFSAVQMYLPMALLKQIKLEHSATCFDLLVDTEQRVLALRFHPQGKHVLRTKPAQIGVTQFVKTHKPVIGQKISLKKIDDGKYKNTWVGQLDKEIKQRNCKGLNGKVSDTPFSTNMVCGSCNTPYNSAYHPKGCPKCAEVNDERN